MGPERALLAAQGYLDLDMPNDALAELDRLSPGDLDREDVLQMRLFVLMRMRSWPAALEVCEKMRRLFPESSSGFIHGAFCLHELGRTAEAKKLLIGGPPILAKDPTFFYNLGCYDAVLGNLEEAVAAIRTSFEMDDKFRDIAKYDPDLKSVNGFL